MIRIPVGRSLALAICLSILPGVARAHFLWIVFEREGDSNVQAFLNETPDPGGPEFLKYVRAVKVTDGGRAVATSLGEDTLQARWVGPLPTMIDAESDLGVSSRGKEPYRLRYTARAQSQVVKQTDPETAPGLRARLVSRDGQPLVQVLFNGKPAANARIKFYPEKGDPTESKADDKGLVKFPGPADGKVALWANWVDPKAGELGGKSYKETRHYATLTVRAVDAPSVVEPTVALGKMPAPAVNSFGAAVLGDWLYVYSGHVGRTHMYDMNTTSKHFRRFNLKDRKTWEDLPLDRDTQGVALVTDGRSLYRVGGMVAKNMPGEPGDLVSVADFAKFDPESKTWTKLPPLPVPRSTHDAVVIGKTLYVSGGWTMKGKDDNEEFLSDTVAVDLTAPEKGWRSIPQPFRRRALSIGEQGGKLYVLGGLTDGGKVERRVDVYDPAKGVWTRGPELPASGRTEGFGTSAFAVDGRLYFSGASGRILRLNSDGSAWETVGAWSEPRITHRLVPGNDRRLIAVGGNHKGEATALIEGVNVKPSAPESPKTAASAKSD